jgi:hypothetical protein
VRTVVQVVVVLAVITGCDVIPFSRNTNYGTDVEVKSADLNDLQDAFVAQHNRSIHFGMASFLPERHDNKWTTDGRYLARDVVISAGDLGMVLDITPWLIPGDRIKELVWHWKNGTTPAAGTVTVSLSNVNILTDVLGALAVNDTDDTSTGGALAARSATVAVAHVVLANHLYNVRMNINDVASDDTATLRGVTIVLEQ